MYHIADSLPGIEVHLGSITVSSCKPILVPYQHCAIHFSCKFCQHSSHTAYTKCTLSGLNKLVDFTHIRVGSTCRLARRPTLYTCRCTFHTWFHLVACKRKFQPTRQWHIKNKRLIANTHTVLVTRPLIMQLSLCHDLTAFLTFTLEE